MTTLVGDMFSVELLDDTGQLPRAEEWNVLAGSAGSPFLTAQWLAAWWRAFGSGRLICLVLRDGRGALRAGAWCRRLPGGRLAATANAHTGDWDVVASDDRARRALWRTLAGLGAGAVELAAIRSRSSLDQADKELRAAGYRTVEVAGVRSPYLELPGTWEELLGSVSRNLRSQLGRRRRALEREGRLRFRTTVGGEELERDLVSFFRVESSGWKSGAGTAILNDPRTERLYRDFAGAAAAAGWLRLHLLELDGVTVAADLNCVFAGGTFLIKTGFDERYGQFSPGLVLRGEVLRAAIQDGSRFYDFLGGPDSYKLRWTAELRPRAAIKAYRGVWRPLALYQARLRPTLKAGVVRARALRGALAHRRRGPGGARDELKR
jgi:CelD/BcsL family acetyltransferase involved in cellulose biosynthesis